MSKAYRLFKQMLVAVIALAMLTSVWPLAAQGEPPRQLPDDRLRDPGVYTAHFAGTQMIERPPVPIGAQPADANPGPWTKAAITSFRDNNWEIYTVNGDGTSSARRTFDPAVDYTPDLNRGATRVAFISTRDGNGEVYVMNADGSAPTRLTFTSANEYLPTWSPDGSKIAFYSYRDGNAEIYVLNADGSNQTRLTNNSAWDGHPAWSPDGSKIVFASQRSGGYDLWTMNANGSNQLQLTAGAAYAAYPDWSPNGATIVFNYDANPQDGFYDLATISASGGTFQSLVDSPSPYDHVGPRWDPTGQYIAYALVHWVNISGQWYWDTAYTQVRDITFTTGWNLDTSGYDWWPDWESVDLATPRSQVTILPPWTNTTNFTVNWSGTDVGASGIKQYDIQYRDGAAGTWTNWLVGTTLASASFTGAYGHTYYFRSRALDYAGNLEAYPGGDGDTSTTIYTNALNGHVFGNREQPIASAIVQSDPLAITPGVSRHDGAYNLYFATSTLYPTLTVTRTNFGYLPPLKLVDASNPRPAYLPPIDDQLLDGQFESGDFTAWNTLGEVTPTITTAAHTGNYAVVLGATVNDFGVGPTPQAIAFDGENIWVANYGSNTVSVLRASDGTHIMTPTVGANPYDIAFDGTNMWVTNNGGGLGNTVSVLRASDGAHVMTPTVGFYPAGVAFDGTNMWVANYLDNTVSVLRASDGALSKTIPVSPGPFGLAFDGTNMWVTNYSSGGIPANTVSVLRISDGTQIMTPTVGSGPQKLVFDGTNMWVTNDFSNDVSVLRASDGSPVGTVPVGFRPYGIAFDGTNIWVVNYNDNNVSVLRASDGSFVTTVPVGVHPAHITFDGTHMWIGNGDSNTVSKRPIASYHSTIEQTITVPPTLTFGTLSLVYQIAEADPVSDTLSVSLVGPTETLAYSLPLTSSGWTHQWWDVSTWTAPTATVRIEFTHGDYPGSSSAVFDDISWGSSNKGGEIVYLPVIYR